MRGPIRRFRRMTSVWSDGANHATGHWLTGRLGGMASDELARAVAADYGVRLDVVEAALPFVHGYVDRCADDGARSRWHRCWRRPGSMCMTRRRA